MSVEDVSIFEQRSENTKTAKMTMWILNAFENYQVMRNCGKLEDLIGKKRGRSAIVVGSGVSLDWGMPHLLKWQGDIICGPSNIQSIIQGSGRIPEYLVGYDSHPINKEFLRLDKFDYTDVTLITNPTWASEVVLPWAECNYPILGYNLTHEFHESLSDDSALYWSEFVSKYKPKDSDPVSWYLRDTHRVLYRNILPDAYPNLPFCVLSTGDTSTQSLIIAELMGYDAIYLLGVDHGFIDGWSGATKYLFNDDTDAWVPVPPRKVAGEVLISDCGVPTSHQMIAYKLSMIALARGLQRPVFEVTFPGKERGIDRFFKEASPDVLGMTENELMLYARTQAEDTDAVRKRAQAWLEDHNKGIYKRQTNHVGSTGGDSAPVGGDRPPA